MTTPVKLTIGQENKIKLGISKKQVGNESKVRFLVTEKGNPKGASLVLEAERVSETEMEVTIPDVNILKENTEYNGVVEVIAGKKIFNPGTLSLIFEEPKEKDLPILSESQNDLFLDKKDVMDVLFTERKRVEKPTQVLISSKPQNNLLKQQIKSLLQEAWQDLKI